MKIHTLLKLLIVVSSGTGVFLSIYYANFSLTTLTYFTNQSNLLIFILYIFYLFIKKYKEPYITILYQGVLAIILTGVVYHLMLRPHIDPETFELNFWVDLLVHTITPILVIVERIIYGTKGILRTSHPLKWLAFPLFYYLFVLVYGFLGGYYHQGTEHQSKYPYFFLNIQEEGFFYFSLVLVLILMIGYLMVLFNRMIFFINHKKRGKYGIV